MKHIRESLEEYMGRLAAQNYFNGAVLVASRGEVLFKKGYGFASFQFKVPQTTTVKFRIGSLTKAFTAMAILRLQQLGSIHIDQTIDCFFPQHKFLASITIRQLLNHTSGIPNFTSTPDYWPKTMRLKNNLDEIIEAFMKLPLEFEPGTSMSYSNSGYLVLTSIIEKVSGMSYADFLQKEILNELGLHDTGVDNGRTIIRSLAQGHTVWEHVLHSEPIDMSFPLGAYGLYSTVEDLYHWCQALLKGSVTDKKILEQMFTSVNGYGFGWFIEEEPHKVCSHFGDINGFVNHLVLYPEEELMVIVLSNINITPVTQISKDLIRIVLEQETVTFEPFQQVAADTAVLAGSYINSLQSILFTFEKEKDLYAIVPKMYGVPYKFKLVPIAASPEQVVCKSDFVHDTYFFRLDGEGRPVSVELIDAYGAKSTFWRRGN